MWAKIVKSSSISTLETKINDVLNTESYDHVVDMKFSSFGFLKGSNETTEYAVLIMFE